MNIVIDIILAAIIGLFVIYGLRKGFVTAVMNLASFLIAGICAVIFSTRIADRLYDGFFLSRISSFIEKSIGDSAAGKSISELFSTKPQFFVDILNRYSTFSEVEGFYNSGKTVSLSDICDFMAAPFAGTVSNVLAFVLVFLAVYIILSIIAFLLNRICHLPILRSANRLLGLLLGAAGGVCLAWVISLAFVNLIPWLSATFPKTITEDLTDKTVLLKWLYNFNPLTFFQTFNIE